MSKTGATDFSCKKAFELSYALFRIAAIAKSRSFAGMLEAKATALLNSVVSEDYENARATLKHIEYFMRLGAGAGLIHLQNAEIIIKEGNGLYAAIAGLPEPTKLQELNLDKFFSKSPLQDKDGVPATVPAKRTKIPAKDGSIELTIKELQDENREIAGMVRPVRQAQGGQVHHEMELQETDDGNPAKAPIRQAAIMDRLRQSGNCRFGELQELLPEISERTLRYDLQALIDKGMIERIGSGKNSFFQLKSKIGQIIELPGVSSLSL